MIWRWAVIGSAGALVCGLCISWRPSLGLDAHHLPIAPMGNQLFGEPDPIIDPGDSLGLSAAFVRHQMERFERQLGIRVHIVSDDYTEARADQLVHDLIEARDLASGSPGGGLLLLVHSQRHDARLVSTGPALSRFSVARLAALSRPLAAHAGFPSSGLAIVSVLEQLQDGASSNSPLDLEADAFRRPATELHIDGYDALERSRRALQRFQAAERQVQAGALLGALLRYEQALELAPANPLFLERYAQVTLALRRPDLAIDALFGLERRGWLSEAGEATLHDAYLSLRDFAGAESLARHALDRNPYDIGALERLRSVLEHRTGPQAGDRIRDRIYNLEASPSQRNAALRLSFAPEQPRLHTREPRRVRGRLVYDHSEFHVTLHNPSQRPVHLDAAYVYSVSGGHQSGLGNRARDFEFARTQGRIDPGESIPLTQHVWGFATDTPHSQISYVFRLCWHGLPSDPKQCRTRRVDLLEGGAETPESRHIARR